MNHVKETLKSGGVAVGTDGTVTGDMRFLAGAGFDFLLFDTQHSPVEIKELRPALASMRGRTASPIVRVGDNRPDQICYALDIGAKGIVVPMVNTKAEAASMVTNGGCWLRRWRVVCPWLQRERPGSRIRLRGNGRSI